MYTVQLTKVAQKELEEAALYYETRQQNLGIEFMLDFEKTKLMLQRNPTALGYWKKGFRAARCFRFPHKLFFKIKGHVVLIYLVAHTRRSNNFILRSLRNQ